MDSLIGRAQQRHSQAVYYVVLDPVEHDRVSVYWNNRITVLRRQWTTGYSHGHGHRRGQHGSHGRIKNYTREEFIG